MRERKVGPLPLLAGIQLEAPEGSPSGLLHALNMESRDGHLATRRGVEYAGFLDNSTYISDPDANPGGVEVAGGTGLGPTIWNLDHGYLGINPALLTPVSDTVVLLYLTSRFTSSFVETPQDTDNVSLDVQFRGEDNVFHSCEYKILSAPGGGVASNYMGNFPPGDGYTHNQGLVVAIRAPFGWKNDVVAETGSANSRFWLKFVLTGAVWNNGAKPYLVQTITPDYSGEKFIYSCQSREGERTFVASAGNQDNTWHVFATEPLTSYNSLPQTSIPATGVVTQGEPAVLQYVSATDELFAVLGQQMFTLNIGTGDSEVFTPDQTAPEYSDIPLEGSVDAPRTVGIFGGRVFMGGFATDPQAIRWTAPNEFWHVLPSSNYATLASRGSGRVVAFQELAGFLYIFTTTNIWRAQLADPTSGNESNLVIELVEETPCASGRTVCAANDLILFLSDDGIHRFDGRRSKRISDQISDLFRPDSRNAYAVMRGDRAIAVWHRIENQYRMFYPSPGSPENDSCLVIDLSESTAWIWGVEPASALDASGATGPIVQRARGTRAQAACWVESKQAVATISNEGIFGYMDLGPTDIESVTRWQFESQTLGFGRGQQSVLEYVELNALRDSFVPFDISVVPDGNNDRVDTRRCQIEPDRLDTTNQIGAVSLAGNMPIVNLDASYAPVQWRGRKRARNHRVRVSSVAPNHSPIKVASMVARFQGEEGTR